MYKINPSKLAGSKNLIKKFRAPPQIVSCKFCRCSGEGDDLKQTNIRSKIQLSTVKPDLYSSFNSTDVPVPWRSALYIKCLNCARRGGPHIDRLTIGGKCL